MSVPTGCRAELVGVRLAALLSDADVETASAAPFEHTAGQCHAASLACVRWLRANGRAPKARVARGSCVGVHGQHSWIVADGDCYASAAAIIDPILWSYDLDATDGREMVWYGTARDGLHVPHGAGNIFTDYGQPRPPTGPVIELRPETPLSRHAEAFFWMVGPLDQDGWGVLAHAPVGGWPAGDVWRAMYESGLGPLIPIDRLGMTTDLNPGGLYW